MSEQHQPSREITRDTLTTPSLDLQRILLDGVQRTEFFASDESDEFQIEREDGHIEGIFKVWAAPVIPLLENPGIGEEAARIKWSEELAAKPLSLFESLERWRAFSTVADRRLQQVFDATTVPDQPQTAIPELFARLHTAFALAGPFYNIEALVADGRDNKSDNPIDFAAGGSTAGRLDTVAMLLPAALKDRLTAHQLDWGDSSWTAINTDTEDLRESFLRDPGTIASQQFKLLNKVGAMAGVDPQSVLFAANALEFIPLQVGGKSNDLSQDEALAALTQLLEQPEDAPTSNSVAKDTNALIRFLNWTPAIKDDDNFSGEHWRYDAVCATAGSLLSLLKQHTDDVFDPEFARIFKDQLAPQLDGLDAASAKGRFLLQLLQEERFTPHINHTVIEHTRDRTESIFEQLEQLQKEEAIVDGRLEAPAALIGGKATGLRRAAQLFGREHIVPDHVITTEAVNAWLGGIEGLNENLRLLDDCNSIEEKLVRAEEVSQQIWSAEPPIDLLERIAALSGEAGNPLVLRSSAFDEDVDLIGPAPGIYESAVGVDPTSHKALSDALKTVVASFFSDKAVSFRELKGLRHKPVMAVLVQKHIPGAGGSVFIKNGNIQLNVAPTPDTINDGTKMHLIEEFSVDRGEAIAHESGIISTNQLARIITMARQAEIVFGPIDMEFVIDPVTDQVRLLQMRSLERPVRHQIKKEMGAMAIALIQDIDRLPHLAAEDVVNLRIDKSIDLERFQGALFRWIVVNRSKLAKVTLEAKIPATCHFANILESLGITIEVEGDA